MATSNGTFTLTINTNAGFGEIAHPHIERQVLLDLLMQVGQAVGSGAPSAAMK